jgi:hypothetical protein
MCSIAPSCMPPKPYAPDGLQDANTTSLEIFFRLDPRGWADAQYRAFGLWVFADEAGASVGGEENGTRPGPGLDQTTSLLRFRPYVAVAFF